MIKGKVPKERERDGKRDGWMMALCIIGKRPKNGQKSTAEEEPKRKTPRKIQRN